MDKEKILQHVDHTLLAVTATWEDIAAVCGDGMRYGVASVCIPPAYVARAKEYSGGKLKICTVTGFPNGYMTAAAKLAETADALANGADEIDMVINLGDVKGGRFESILDEIKQIKAACGGKILKVIVEACLLNGAEKLKLCETVTAAGADFIKTSTGFSTGGATLDDVRLFRKHVGKNVRIKAAGGIKTLADAEAFISAGADRLGTSAIVKLVKGQEAGGY